MCRLSSLSATAPTLCATETGVAQAADLSFMSAPQPCVPGVPVLTTVELPGVLGRADAVLLGSPAVFGRPSLPMAAFLEHCSTAKREAPTPSHRFAMPELLRWLTRGRAVKLSWPPLPLPHPRLVARGCRHPSRRAGWKGWDAVLWLRCVARNRGLVARATSAASGGNFGSEILTSLSSPRGRCRG